jgi:hypothetical protein
MKGLYLERTVLAITRAIQTNHEQHHDAAQKLDKGSQGCILFLVSETHDLILTPCLSRSFHPVITTETPLATTPYQWTAVDTGVVQPRNDSLLVITMGPVTLNTLKNRCHDKHRDKNPYCGYPYAHRQRV